MAKTISIPVTIPVPVYQLLKKVKRTFGRTSSESITIDIGGERNIEWSFMSAQIQVGPGEALEFGCEQGYMSLVAAQRGFHVVANDLEPQVFSWKHPGVQFVRGDFLKLDLPRNHFDLVIDCSSIEHVGIAGRYGITVGDDEGDLDVMRRIVDVLRPGGRFLMTGPCGIDAVLAPWCRVYGRERLPRLFAGLHLEQEVFWRKNEFNQWVECDRQTALSFQPRNHETNPYACAYNLGCFVLSKPR
jgi:SAM-dependent methyltransferase